MKKCVKKSIGLMLVASMTVSSLTGCGSTAEESKHRKTMWKKQTIRKQAM